MLYLFTVRYTCFMISVLIPIYNYDVVALVKHLHENGMRLQVPFEIICIDDGSELSYQNINQRITHLPGVRLEALGKNIGRSAIRNLLASKAQYQYFLFLDCDCSIPQKDFLDRYLEHCNTQTVLVGGRTYHDTRPEKDRTLHWKVGRTREQKLDSGFQSNNFMIHARAFHAINFDERIQGYGHEDTLFGYLLEKQGYKIRHIDNPVIHEDLQPATEFIAKQKNAIRNLISLERMYPDVETRLTRICKSITNLKLSLPIIHMFTWSERLLHRGLADKFPSVMLLDLYKIGFYLLLKNEKETIV